jgi:hypothetical protein
MDINMDQPCIICGKPGAMAAGGTPGENQSDLRTKGGVCMKCLLKYLKGQDPRPKARQRKAPPSTQGRLFR